MRRKRAYPLGDERRLESLPESADTRDFFLGYARGLEQWFVALIRARKITHTEAKKSLKEILKTVFGDYKTHYGIYHYLRLKNYDNLSGRSLVALAERLFLQGWRVSPDHGGRFFLVRPSGERVIEVTAQNGLPIPLYIGENELFLFLEEPLRERIMTFSRAIGDLADTIEFARGHIADQSSLNQLTNLHKLFLLVKLSPKYTSRFPGLTLYELFDAGWRLSSQVLPTPHVPLELSGETILVTPASSDINSVYLINQSVLSLLADNIRTQLYKSFADLKTPQAKELKEMGNFYGVITRGGYPNVVEAMGCEEVIRTVSLALRQQTSLRLLENLSMVFVTEMLLLGNRFFGPGSFGIDAQELFVYYPHHHSFSLTLDELYGNKEGLFTIPQVKSMVKFLPEGFVNSLRQLEFTDLDYYGGDFKKLLRYLKEAQRMILRTYDVGHSIRKKRSND